MKQAVTKLRFCPSPTGLIHLGNMRTALFNALYAKKTQGVFLLRIEDTDAERSRETFTEQLQHDLKWLGLEWQEGPQVGGDNGPYWQSQRQAIYDHYYQQLEQSGQAYPCFCTPEQLALSRKVQRASGKAPRYAGTCRSLSSEEVASKRASGLQPTLRFAIPRGEVVEFADVVKGNQRFQTDDIGDFIIRRADGTSAFMFCNAIDDAMMKVTHVLRGEDHLTNTPRQIMLLNALQLPIPQYAHITMIVGPDGSPLSKRHGSRNAQELREAGYFPLAVVNYLARLGHYYAQNDLMSLDALAAAFEPEQLGRSPARYDASQLDYWQQQVVATVSDEALWSWLDDATRALVPAAKKTEFIATVRPNIMFPQDALKWAEIFFQAEFAVAAELETILHDSGSQFFHCAQEAITQYGTDYQALCEHLKQSLGIKGKALFQPLRVALTGELHGPQLAPALNLLGTERSLQRLRQAEQFVKCQAV